MDVLQQGIITLIRSSLTGEKLTLPGGFDLEEAYPQILRHGILTMAYDGALRCGVDKKLPVMQKMFQRYVQAMLRSEEQIKAAERICAAFDVTGVDCMPLKGYNLKQLYPKPELRQMGDADILIRTGQYDEIRPIMQELGFEEKVESDHEFIWVGRELLVELHKRLIPSYHKDYYGYFGDGWKLAKAQSGTWYAMTPEDEYIYLFTHFAKHYRDGGIGCRHVCDLWVWRKTHPQMDEDYISGELRKLRLLEFEQNMRCVLAYWFEGAAPDEKVNIITEVILRSGLWGPKDAHAAAAGAKIAAEAGSVRGGKVLSACRMLFPGAEGMQSRYPVLKKHPALTPVFWPVRWVTAILFRRDSIKTQWEHLRDSSEETIESYRQALNFVGLNYTIKD